MAKTFFGEDFSYPCPQHRALTGWVRHNTNRGIQWDVAKIRNQCDVAPYLGALPPELRARVPAEQMDVVTNQFRMILEDFLISKSRELADMQQDMQYEIPELGKLFGTRCVLQSRGINAYGVNPWAGAVGYVCKLSFPEIGADYALKLYYPTALIDDVNHGAMFEIPTAFAAKRAEPRDNNDVYMASLMYEKYMLSAWGGDGIDNVPLRQNKYKIFRTSFEENESRNWRGGRRIDWGETYKTPYGRLTYHGRKFYRQIMGRNTDAAKKMYQGAKDNLTRRDLDLALKVADNDACDTENLPVRMFLRDFNVKSH